MKIGNLNVYGIIYKITNNINGKIYIGQTIDGFKIRYNGGRWWNQTHNIHLKNSANKYGHENFEVVEIFDIAFSKIELDIKETLYIVYYQSNNRLYGYNKKEGGSHGRHSKESIIKMSKIHTGVKLSEETRRKMSNVRKGKRKGIENPMYGISPVDRMDKEKYNDWILQKKINMTGEKNPMYGMNGELNPFYGKQHTDETKRKISKANKGRNCKSNHHNSKIVEIYNKNKILIKKFYSVIECAEWLVLIEKCKTIGTAKYIINKNSKNGKIYKEMFFKTYAKSKS